MGPVNVWHCGGADSVMVKVMLSYKEELKVSFRSVPFRSVE